MVSDEPDESSEQTINEEVRYPGLLLPKRNAVEARMLDRAQRSPVTRMQLPLAVDSPPRCVGGTVRTR